MQRLLGFYIPLEDAIDRVHTKPPSDGLGYRYSNRSHFLREDLADLGFSEREIFDTPQCSALYDLVTPTTLAGVVYVIEGSTLGAAQIDRAVARLLRQDVTDGRRFWAWCRSQNKQRSTMANAFLECAGEQGVPLKSLIKGAEGTFQALAEWLEPLNQPSLGPESRQL